MGFWNFLTQSLGLLGKPVHIPNLERRFGSANLYTAIQIEHDGVYDKKFEVGEEEVLLFTDHAIQEARERAKNNAEDVQAFLLANKARDAAD